MIDADAFAALICDWCLEVQEGQQIKIETTTLAVAYQLANSSALSRPRRRNRSARPSSVARDTSS